MRSFMMPNHNLDQANLHSWTHLVSKQKPSSFLPLPSLVIPLFKPQFPVLGQPTTISSGWHQQPPNWFRFILFLPPYNLFS